MPEAPAESPAATPDWATPQYLQVVERFNATAAAWNETLATYLPESEEKATKDDLEMVGLISVAGAAYFTVCSIGLNIAQSLARIAYALDHNALDVNDMDEDDE